MYTYSFDIDIYIYTDTYFCAFKLYSHPTIEQLIELQMSDLNNFKKADLTSVARKVGIHVVSKDTKKILIEKISNYIEQNPTQAVETIKAIEQKHQDSTNSEQQTLVDEASDAEEVDTEEAEADEDDEEADEDDSADPDYNGPPPIDLKSKIIDPIIEFVEETKDKIYDFTDSVGITALEYSDELREKLSSTVTINYAELVFEVFYFLYTYVPLVPIKNNDSIHQVFKDNFDILNDLECEIPDFTALWDFDIASVFFNWGVYAVALPLLISYYVNFTRRSIVIGGLSDSDDEDDEFEDETDEIITRINEYDPLVFALSKVIIFFFVIKNSSTLTTLSSYSGIFNALKNHFLIQLGLYGKFADGLGNFPIVIGLFSVVIAIYSQFENDF